MPVVVKPGTSSAIVAARAVEVVVERGIIPDGALSMVCGSAGNLLDLLGPQDVLAFTGSAATARALRGKPNLLGSSTRVNVEADSLNAAVLAPGAADDEETWAAFVRDVTREITQKSGQKCTAVRRILVPRDRIEAVEGALVEVLQATVVGDPRDEAVTMGPLATEDQLKDAVAGVAALAAEGDLVLGDGKRVDGRGAAAGRGFYFAPTLLRARDPERARVVHEREVFGPAATLLPYDGEARSAAALVARSEGSLVTSVYANDRGWIEEYLREGGHTSGRLYLGSEKVAAQLPGSGLAMPQLLHGGPGRAGGGEELGGLRGLGLYLQRVAVTGDRAIVERLTGARGERADEA
jgi:oxepin-CoA hydrolase/3-oxo-5,6-dehydrosuberyl-CoA semialdehyde dehydrogenase